MTTEEEWVPSGYERYRALMAGVFGYKQKDGKSFCRHGIPSWDDCAECKKAILDFERGEGRNPLDPMQWKKDHLNECMEERDKARKALAELEGPISEWRLWSVAFLAAGLVYGLSYQSLGAALAAATFVIILVVLWMREDERRARVAIREAHRDLDEWERRWWKAEQAMDEP